jgi:3-oxoacyl-[acyl-carrier protein] reductase
LPFATLLRIAQALDVELDPKEDAVMIGIDLVGKVALVTGASRGLGEATARRLHAAGAQVAINYFPDAAGEHARLAQAIVANLGEHAICMAADVTQFDQVERMVAEVVEHFGGLDLVVNNAGILRDRTLAKMSLEEWNAVVQTNLTGVFHVCQAASRQLRDGGRIVSLGSVAAAIGFFGQANYAAAKAGVAAMGRVLSRELAKRQITVNTVAPGVILTEMGKSIPETARAEMLRQIPLAHFGEPDDIANAILFFCSDLAKYITGQTLHVNGGWYA